MMGFQFYRRVGGRYRPIKEMPTYMPSWWYSSTDSAVVTMTVDATNVVGAIHDEVMMEVPPVRRLVAPERERRPNKRAFWRDLLGMRKLLDNPRRR